MKKIITYIINFLIPYSTDSFHVAFKEYNNFQAIRTTSTELSNDEQLSLLITKVKTLANNGKYFSCQIDYLQFSNGKHRIEYLAHIEGYEVYRGTTIDETINKLKAAICLPVINNNLNNDNLPF